MKILIYFVFLLLPVVVLSQNKVDDDLISIEKRVNELEKTITKRKLTEKEEEFDSLPKIKFDFSNPKKITIPKDIKEGEFFQVEITGINLNRYVVVMESSDTVFSTPLNFPTFGTIDLTSLSSLVNSLTPKSTIAEEAIAKISELPSNNKAFNHDIFLNAEKEVSPFLEKYDLEMERLQKQKELRDFINARIGKATIQAQLYLADLKITNSGIDDKKYNYMAYRILRQTDDTSEDYKPALKADLQDYNVLRTSLKELKEKIDADIKSLREFMETDSIKVFLAETENVDLKDNLVKREKALVEASGKTDKAIEIISADNVEKQLKSVLNLYKGDTYTSLPIQFNGEQVETNIKIVRKDSTSGLQPYHLPPIKFPKQKYYWSVGPSIYYAGFDNERVSTETKLINDSTQRYNLLKESPLEGEMGAALLLRGGVKVEQSSLGVHFSAGTGLSLGEEVKPRMLFGGGLSVGQKHSLVLDIGSIGGYVNVVSSNADYKKDYIDKPEVLVNDFKFKFFWSVGYAFRL